MRRGPVHPSYTFRRPLIEPCSAVPGFAPQLLGSTDIRWSLCSCACVRLCVCVCGGARQTGEPHRSARRTRSGRRIAIKLPSVLVPPCGDLPRSGVLGSEGIQPRELHGRCAKREPVGVRAGSRRVAQRLVLHRIHCHHVRQQQGFPRAADCEHGLLVRRFESEPHAATRLRTDGEPRTE